ncbi:hypothetical protein OS242_15575 [Tumebacillus sp. DT12]|uniref:Uncharacterized protein n=1 Tax=Tumebacillus lacus TaxID=2995335 RepID=A0ABT3X9C7_9BACL|nr:hypothetical protein [Tumebacillus lacus]MCX7571369.1 hypothetical protein [Tumebacillus lacus]
MKKWPTIMAALLFVAILVVFLIPREDPAEYVYREFPQTHGWGNLQVEKISQCDEIVTLEVTY